jgi:hypothetical protein
MLVGKKPILTLRRCRMGLYSGFDLHSSNTYVGIIDEDDKRIWKKKLRNEPGLMSATLRPFKEDILRIVVESTYNWYWLVDLMIEEGYRVHLTNPSKVQQYSGIKHGDDEDDAFRLAELLRLKILPEGYIYPKEHRPLRDLGASGEAEDVAHSEFSEHLSQEHRDKDASKSYEGTENGPCDDIGGRQ